MAGGNASVQHRTQSPLRRARQQPSTKRDERRIVAARRGPDQIPRLSFRHGERERRDKPTRGEVVADIGPETDCQADAVDGCLQGVGLYEQKIHVLGEMNKTIACSIDRARRELGYEPQVSLREGMRASVRWCIENGQQI